MSIDDVISTYVGEVAHSKKRYLTADLESQESARKKFQRDKIILGALKCAKANGYTGEE